MSVDEGIAHREWNKENKQRKEKMRPVLITLKDGECPG